MITNEHRFKGKTRNKKHALKATTLHAETIKEKIGQSKATPTSSISQLV